MVVCEIVTNYGDGRNLLRRHARRNKGDAALLAAPQRRLALLSGAVADDGGIGGRFSRQNGVCHCSLDSSLFHK